MCFYFFKCVFMCFFCVFVIFTMRVKIRMYPVMLMNTNNKYGYPCNMIWVSGYYPHISSSERVSGYPALISMSMRDGPYGAFVKRNGTSPKNRRFREPGREAVNKIVSILINKNDRSTAVMCFQCKLHPDNTHV